MDGLGRRDAAIPHDDGGAAVVAGRRRPIPGWLRTVLVLGLLYLFLVGVKLLEGGVKGLGSDIHETLFEGVTNPLAGLAVGVLATVLVQSSSVTTSTIVGLVAAGVVSVETAVPMIMGANIGTTVTNTLVSVGHIRRGNEFRLALTGATMHDFFNLIAVALLLPIELLTKVLSRSAQAVAELFAGRSELGATFDSPIKGAIKVFATRFEDLVEALGFTGTAAAVVTIVIGIGLIFFTLAFITKNMKVLVAARIERSLNAALARSGMVGILVGLIVTVAVQSSSITTSILVPLIAAGVLTVPNAFPITLGANVGTTITALLAALGAATVDALTIALVHTFFNLAGILIIYPWRPLRMVPIRLAGALADLAMRNKTVVMAYLVVAFLAVPIGILVVFG